MTTDNGILMKSWMKRFYPNMKEESWQEELVEDKGEIQVDVRMEAPDMDEAGAEVMDREGKDSYGL